MNNEPAPFLWNVPPRNPYFTSREDVLNLLHGKLQSSKEALLTQPQAICGLGGIGKTQTAVEYVHRYCHEYRNVLWIRSDTKGTLSSNFIAIARLLNLPEQNEADYGSTINIIQAWLETNTHWLLIFDNVTTDTINMVSEFIPKKGKGHILLTTTMYKIVGLIAQRIELRPLTQEDGALFLLRRSGVIAPVATLAQVSHDVQNQAFAITEVMGGLPLALDRAGAYVEGTQCDLSDYLHLYEKRRNFLLKRWGKSSSDHPQSVATTLSLSFAKIEEANPTAAELLRLCAFLSPNGIPERIITEVASDPGPVLQSIAHDPYKLNVAIRDLLNFSFVQRDNSAQTLIIHRLVQAVLKDDMDKRTKRTWARRSLSAIHCAYPDVKAANSEADRFYQQGMYARAEPHFEDALSYYQQLLAPDHPYILIYLLKVGGLYLDKGDYGQAEEYYKRAQTLCQMIWGENSPDMVTCLDALAELSLTKGDYEQAATLCKQAWETSEQILVADDPARAFCLQNQAEIYRIHGKFSEAETRYRQALMIRKQQLSRARQKEEQKLAQKYRNVAACLNGLAELYRFWGKFAIAQQCYEEAQSFINKLGTDHPDLAASLNGLAQVYCTLGYYTQAEKLSVRALQICNSKLGENHLITVACQNTQAELYYTLGKYAEAKRIYGKALNFFVPRQRTNSFDASAELLFAAVLNNIGRLLMDWEKRPELARQCYQRALGIRKQKLGLEHPEIAISLNNLAQLYLDQGQSLEAAHKDDGIVEAEQLYNNALSVGRTYLGEKFPDMPHDSSVWIRLDLIAQRLYERAWEICKTTFGVEHPYTIQCLANLAILYRGQNQFDKAESYYKKALELTEQTLGHYHPQVARRLNNLAELYYARGMYRKAQPLYRKAISIGEQTLGKEHPYIATILENLARLQRSMQSMHSDPSQETTRLELNPEALEARAQAIMEKHKQENPLS